MDDRGRDEDAHRQTLGDRADTERYRDGKVAFTDRERTAFVDHLLEEEREAQQARWRAEARRAKILDAITSNVVSGAVLGVVAASMAWIGQWVAAWVKGHWPW